MNSEAVGRVSQSRFLRIFDIFWKWAGRVPLGFKLIGVVLTAMLFPALALLWWLFHNQIVLETFLSENDHVAGLIVAILVAALFGLSVAYLLTRLLMRPISEIARIAHLVEHGDLYQRAPVWANDEIGALGRAFNAMIDTLTRSQTELETSNERLRTVNRAHVLLYELAAMTNQSLNLESILSIGLARALEVFNAQAGLIALTNEEQKLQVHAASSMGTDLQRQVITDIAEPLLASFVETGTPQFISDFAASPLSNRLIPLYGQWGYRSLACLPMKSRTGVQGILIGFSLTAEPVKEKTASLLMAVCNQLGIAVENALLWEELKRKEAIRARLLAKAVTAQEQERERISRELHDETGQALTALLVQLKVLERLPDIDSVAALARDLRELVAQTLEEVRRLARDLRPSTLDDLGLVPTLDWYIKAYRQKTNLDVEFIVDVPENTRLMPLTELILYRVVQEALTNIARHAAASQAWIRLEQRNRVIRLSVEDDGCGFDVAETLNTQERSLGLLGMQERVELIGATLHLNSTPGYGTCLQVEVSLDESMEEVRP